MSSLPLLLLHIQDSLGWGPPAQWTAAHFEELSERIHTRTGVQLSAATLKRLWGRVKYTSSPSATTLNALARFAGFDSWIASEEQLGTLQANEATKLTPPDKAKKPKAEAQKSRFNMPPAIVGLGSAVVVFLFAAGVSRFLPQPVDLPVEVMKFELAQINKGLPATVQFRYTVNGGRYDSMQVQQSWDERLRYRVDPQLGFYACTYYEPGVYKAKLLLDTTDVAQQTLVISSDGWLGTLHQNGQELPQYVRGEALTNDGKLASLFNAYIDGQPVQSRNTNSTIHYVGAFDNVPLKPDRFRLQTTFRSQSSSPCTFTQLILYGDSSTVVLPFGKTGCSGEFMLFAGGVSFNGEVYDLSGFGADGDQAIKATVTVDGRHLSVTQAEKLAFQTPLSNPFGRLLGVKWRFEGLGEVVEFAVE